MIIVAIALSLIVGASTAVGRIIMELSRLNDNMQRYNALMDEAEEIEDNKTQEEQI